MPAIDCDLVIPPGSKLGTPAVLRLKFNSRNLLERIFLLVPFDTNAVERDENEGSDELPFAISETEMSHSSTGCSSRFFKS